MNTYTPLKFELTGDVGSFLQQIVFVVALAGAMPAIFCRGSCRAVCWTIISHGGKGREGNEPHSTAMRK